MTTKKSGRLTITRFHAQNALGLEDLTIDLDKVSIIEGANAAGKSSILKLLRACLGIDRTSLARLSRVDDKGEPTGEPFAEVLLVGEDREVMVSRKGGDSPEVRERVGLDWRKVPRPVEWLRNLIDVQGANPALWLAADDEERARAVLEAMPLEGYSRVAALKACGLEGFTLPRIPDGLHPLEDLEQIEAAVFSARTEVKRQERSEHDAAVKLLSGLPAEPPSDISERIAKGEGITSRLAEEIAKADSEADAAEKAAIRDAESHLLLVEKKLEGDLNAEVMRIRAEAERQIAELNEKRLEALRIEQASTEGAKNAARTDRLASRGALEAKRKTLSEGREKLAALRSQQQSIETDRHVRATAESAEAKAREHEARAAELTASLEALVRYRLELAEQLPIKGLAVKFDEKGRKSLTLDGVPLSQVNDGRLATLAAEVSLLRQPAEDSGEPQLRLVLLDGIEKINPSRRAALLRHIAERGSQVIAACVSEDSLRVLRGEEALGAKTA